MPTPKLSEYRNKFNFPLSETTFRRWKAPAFHLRKVLIGGSFTRKHKERAMILSQNKLQPQEEVAENDDYSRLPTT
jgi:hypothetical protein